MTGLFFASCSFRNFELGAKHGNACAQRGKGLLNVPGRAFHAQLDMASRYSSIAAIAHRRQAECLHSFEALLEVAHARYGKLAWKELFQPAIELSMRISLIGLASSPAAAMAENSSVVAAMPVPRPPRM